MRAAVQGMLPAVSLTMQVASLLLPQLYRSTPWCHASSASWTRPPRPYWEWYRSRQVSPHSPVGFRNASATCAQAHRRHKASAAGERLLCVWEELVCLHH